MAPGRADRRRLVAVLLQAVLSVKPGAAAAHRRAGRPPLRIAADGRAAGPGPVGRPRRSPRATSPTSRSRGMSGYLLAFEIISVHLLVVLVGAAYLARAKRRRAGSRASGAATSRHCRSYYILTLYAHGPLP